MAIELTTSDLFEKWISYSSNKSIVECEFFHTDSERTAELLGPFASNRLAAFGEHASGSLFSFYSDSQKASTDDSPVAWLDSEGAPCIIISKNLKKFLSVLPYGPGFIYTVAAVIENNLGEEDLLVRAQSRLGKGPTDLLNDARTRFLDLDIFIQWLKENNIQVSSDPVADIIQAHLLHDDLTPWIAENLS